MYDCLMILATRRFDLVVDHDFPTLDHFATRAHPNGFATGLRPAEVVQLPTANDHHLASRLAPGRHLKGRRAYETLQKSIHRAPLQDRPISAGFLWFDGFVRLPGRIRYLGHGLPDIGATM